MGYLGVLGLVFCGHVLLSWAGALFRGRRARKPHKDQHIAANHGNPLVSVIVPAWNEENTVVDCLQALRRSSHCNWELIIVAGGTDKTYDVCKEHGQQLLGATLIRQEPRGKNAALADGYEVARGDIIVLLDADSIVSSGWLRELVEPLLSDYDASTGNYFALHRTPVSQAYELAKVSDYYIRQKIVLQGCGGIALRRSVVDALGGFDPDVYVGVDWDLDVRVSRMEFRKTFCQAATVITELPSSPGEWWRNELRWRRAHLQAVIRHGLLKSRSRLTGLMDAYVYVFAWFLCIVASVAVISLAAGAHSTGGLLTAGLLMILVWAAARRQAVALEVLAYTSDPSWKGQLLVQPVLLIATLLAGVIASVSLKQNAVHFKGERKRRPKRTRQSWWE